MKKEHKFVLNFIEFSPLDYSNIIILSNIVVGLILLMVSIYTNYSKASLIVYALYTLLCLYIINTKYLKMVNIFKPFKKEFKREIETKIVHRKGCEIKSTEYKEMNND